MEDKPEELLGACTEDHTQRPGEASWGRSFGYISSRAGGDPEELISRWKKLLEKNN